MTDKVEIQGKTVDEAVAEALLRMGARRDEVDVTVLEEPKSGLFGLIGNRPARVIVRRRAGGARRGRSNDFRVDSNDHPAHELGSGDGRGGSRGSRGGRGGSGRGPRNEEGREARGRGEGRGENRSEGRGENRTEGRSDGRSERRGGGRGDRRSEGPGEARGENRGEGRNERRGRSGDRRNEGGRERRPETEQPPREEVRAAAGEPVRDQDGDEKRTRRRRGRRGGRGRGGSGVREGREGRDGREQPRAMPLNTAGEHIEDDLLRSIADEQAEFHARLQAQEAQGGNEAVDGEARAGERGEGRSRGRRGGRSRGGRGRGGERGEGSERTERAERNDRSERNDRRPAAETANGPTEAILPADDGAPQAAPAAPVRPASASVEEPIATGIKAGAYAQPKRGLTEEMIDGGLTDLAQGMLLRAGFPCRCEVKPGEYRLVKIITDDISAGMLIGRHGQTIDAVEHLVERMASTATDGRVRMNLDINNYRRRREDSLADRVDQAVAEVRATGNDVHLEPMDARERRIVHLQAESIKGLRTWTVGGIGGKHVVIGIDDGTVRAEEMDPVEIESEDAADGGYGAAAAETPAVEAPAADEGEEQERPGADA